MEDSSVNHGKILLPLILGVAICAIGWKYNHSAAADDDRANLTSDAKMAQSSGGCTTLEDSIRSKELLFSGDEEAHTAFLNPRIKLDECRFITEGDRIAVEKREPNPLAEAKALFGDFYCVRKYGHPNCYWIYGIDVFGKPI